MSSVPSVRKTHAGHCLMASFSGDMDCLTGPMFRTEFLNLIDSGARFIVLDLAGVPFCDSAGLNALLAARRHAHETGARLALARVQVQPRQLLKLTGVDRILDVYDATEDAMTDLASRRDNNSGNEGNADLRTRTASPGRPTDSAYYSPPAPAHSIFEHIDGADGPSVG
ncbi:STAS domain-containing protein [Streptomyces filipinensis]|uniref:STAS domain-containing protein n=1 Tax=Streptomyces TaxID=1883 RepID=UPI00099DBF5A